MAAAVSTINIYTTFSENVNLGKVPISVREKSEEQIVSKWRRYTRMSRCQCPGRDVFALDDALPLRIDPA